MVVRCNYGGKPRKILQRVGFGLRRRKWTGGFQNLIENCQKDRHLKNILPVMPIGTAMHLSPTQGFSDCSLNVGVQKLCGPSHPLSNRFHTPIVLSKIFNYLSTAMLACANWHFLITKSKKNSRRLYLARLLWPLFHLAKFKWINIG